MNLHTTFLVRILPFFLSHAVGIFDVDYLIAKICKEAKKVISFVMDVRSTNPSYKNIILLNILTWMTFKFQLLLPHKKIKKISCFWQLYEDFRE